MNKLNSFQSFARGTIVSESLSLSSFFNPLQIGSFDSLASSTTILFLKIFFLKLFWTFQSTLMITIDNYNESISTSLGIIKYPMCPLWIGLKYPLTIIALGFIVLCFLHTKLRTNTFNFVWFLKILRKYALKKVLILNTLTI